MKRILEKLFRFWTENSCRFAVAGAFALHAYGLQRATADLDFFVEASCRKKLIEFLENLGYKTVHSSTGYSNHIHPDGRTIPLDFIYVDQSTADELFPGAGATLAVEGMQLPVPRPEHLVALKVLAIRNDPSRTFRELADIQFLMSLPGIDDTMIRSYFKKHDLMDRYYEIREQDGN